MAVTYESIQTATDAGSGVTVTKPTSLAVGDLMVAFISSATGGAGGVAHTGPSGWTKIEEQVPTNGAVLTTWAIVATSTETAASNFTWTGGGTNQDTGGAILRFTSTNGFNAVSDNVVSNSNTALTTTGVTTLSTSTMLILCGSDEDATQTATFSGYSVTNNDPTWTERADFPSAASGLRVSIGIATASYNLKQATGSSSITSSLGTSDVSCALVAITENINATGTVTTASSTQAAFTPTGSAGTVGTVTTTSSTQSAFTPTGKGTTPPVWTNTSKSSTTWTNTSKS